MRQVIFGPASNVSRNSGAQRKAEMRLVPRNLLAGVDKAFDRLRIEIRNREQIELDNSRTLEAASGATDFVRRWQNSDGSWGQGAMMSSSLALNSLSLWAPEIREWDLIDGGKGGIKLAWEWLEDQQVGPKWENIWNTSLICQSAFRLRTVNRQSVERALTWLVEQGETEWGLKSGLPVHHIAQAIVCFDTLGMVGERDSAVGSMLEYLSSFPELSPYMTGQALHALVVSGVTTEAGVGLRLVKEAQRALTSDHVSISNFIDVCVCFKGLGSALGGMGTKNFELERTLANFFSPSRLQGDGSWYRDLTFTSLALLAMTEVRATRVLRAYPTEIYVPLEKARSEICRDLTKEIHDLKQVALTSGLAGVLSASLAALIFLQIQRRVEFSVDSDLVWFIVPVLLGIIAWLVRFAWARARPVKGKDR